MKKIIILNPKNDFKKSQMDLLKKLGSVAFIETADNYQSNPVFYEKSEKVIAVGPETVNWEFPNEFISKVANIKGICIPTTSFSWIDGAFLRKKDIDLLNVPKYSTESVAEYAICLMLNLAKKLPLIIKNDWRLDYNKHQGWEIKGKTMGIIGLGAIGTRIAELGQAMGMNVVYWSRKSRDRRFTYKELKNVLKEADFIFPSLAKNKQTAGILDKSKIDLMKNGSFLVSITGDDLFDFKYATQKVEEGKLAGIALESDKYTTNNMHLADFKGNVWITPPIAWFTKEAFAEDIRIWVENIKSVIREKPQNVVN